MCTILSDITWYIVTDYIPIGERVYINELIGHIPMPHIGDHCYPQHIHDAENNCWLVYDEVDLQSHDLQVHCYCNGVRLHYNNIIENNIM